MLRFLMKAAFINCARFSKVSGSAIAAHWNGVKGFGVKGDMVTLMFIRLFAQ